MVVSSISQPMVPLSGCSNTSQGSTGGSRQGRTPRDFHATHSFQQFIGLIQVKEHLDQGFTADARQLLGKIGLQCGFYYPPSLSEPMQGVVEEDLCPESVIYDGGNHIVDHLHHPNSPVAPLPLF